MSDDRETVSYDDALKVLPTKSKVHTFRSSPGMLIGADWDREDVLSAIRKFGCELSGSQATHMNHGLVLFDPKPLFIETVK